MRIQAWRGQVVEGSGLAKKQLMGNIGDRRALGKLVKMDDWNQYTVISSRRNDGSDLERSVDGGDGG